MDGHRDTRSYLRSGGAFIVLLLGMLLTLSCAGTGDDTAAIERHKRLAGELRDTKLYEAAID